MKRPYDPLLARRVSLVFFLFPFCALASIGLWHTTGQANPEAPARLDAPFTLDVQTPRVAWGKPAPGAPVHAFVVPSVSEGRTLVELAERFNLTYDTVMIDEAWDVNTWTVGLDENYEARNYKLVYQYLEQDLTRDSPYDVIVLPSLHGWNRLPQAVREAIRRRVEQGTGLVLIHPTTGIPNADDPPTERPLNDFAPDYNVPRTEELWNLSPLVGVLSDQLNPKGFRDVRPDAVTTGPWKAVSENYITANVPLESFPSDYLKHYKYHAGKDSTVLVTGAEGEPIVATKMFGKGRVVALGYLNTGLSPMIDWKFFGQRNDHWYEYFYSLLGRSILWAANREPALGLRSLAVEGGEEKPGTISVRIENTTPLASADLMGQIFNEWGENESSVGLTVMLKRGTNPATLTLPRSLSAGRHQVDVILSADGKHYDWGSVAFDLPKPDEILSLATDRPFYTRGDKVQVSFETKAGKPAKFLVELLDNRARLLACASPSTPQEQAAGPRATLEVGNYSTNIGWVRVTLLESDGARERKIDRKQTRVNFASLDRQFGAYELIMPWYGPPSYQPWTPTLDEQFRKMGVTTVEDPIRNFQIISEVHAPGFGVYWHYRKPYLEQKEKFLETGEKKYLIRAPDLASDEWLETLRSNIRESMAKDKSYQPLAYYLADESSLTAYGDPLDFSWSAPTLAKFRAWLKGQYSTLDALNAEWETQFKTWEEVQPLTTAEAQAKGNYAGWMDHRTFMEQVLTNAVRVAAETVRQEDPGGLPSISGTQAPGPSNAVNWYLLDQIVDYLQPYSEDDQDELHRTMHPGQVLTGFTGYASHGKSLRYELWHRLFHGQMGASLFWHYTALNADLSLAEQGRDLADAVNEFRNEGLALLLRGAERENCGVAVHYSLLSVRGQWITDGHIAPHEISNGDETSAHLKRFHQNRSAWLRALHDAGYQFDFLTTEQIEAGKLAGFKVLILPDSIAISDTEEAAIRKFVENGGLLISDVETALMDGHGRWQAAGRLDDVKGLQRLEMRSAPTDMTPAKIGVTLSGGRAEIEVLPASLDLRTTTGRPAAAAAHGSLFLIDNPFGAGRSISLNFWMTDYEKFRKTGANGPRLALLREYLNLAGVRPVVDVRTSLGRPLACSEVVRFRKGKSQYLGILPEPDCADAGLVSINFSTPRYAYDLRAHRPLGRVSRAQGRLVDGEPLLFGLEPTPLGRLSIAAAEAGKGPASVKAGDTVKFSIRLSTRAGEAVPADAVHLEVRNPAGKTLDYYGGNLALVNGVAEFAVPLALNDRPGVWRITVREPYTHQTTSTTFMLTR